MTTPDYGYDALPAADKYIRLLTILPRSNGDPIELALKTLSLAEAAGKYDAISYTWGDTINMSEVSVDGKSLWLRQNISRFMDQASSTSLSENLNRYLWIDSICINQKNTAEKNEQVKLMAAIFSKARRVIVWLGEASQTSVWAEASFGDYDRMLDFMKDAYSRRQNPEQSDLMLKTDIRSLMTSLYWTRLWIVQELALAQQAVFVSGTDLCDLVVLNLGSLAPWYFEEGDSGKVDEDWRAAAKQVHQLVERHVSREMQSAFRGLADLVEFFADQQCYDPHDHVYGLLGLNEGAENVNVDYKTDMEILFWEVLRTTHQQMSTNSSGSQRDSNQWNMEKVLNILGLQLKDVFKHPTLKDRLAQDRFAVELKNNGQVIPSKSVLSEISDLAAKTPLFSLIVTWYFYGQLSIIVSSDVTDARLVYAFDPQLNAYKGDIFGKGVQTHEMTIPDHMKQEILASLRAQGVTHEDLTKGGIDGTSLSAAFSFRSLIELSRLSAIGNDYFQPAEKTNGGEFKGYVGGPRQWSNGLPWAKVMDKVERARSSIPSNLA